MAFGRRRLDRGLAFQQPVECIVKFALIDLAEAELSAEARCGGGRRRHPMRCSLPAFTEPGRPCVLLLGPLPSRLGTARVLTVCLACGIVIIAAVALGRLPYLILLVAIVTMGICVVGGQLGANGLSAPKYPARIRTTGIGWVLGIGRLDGIVGSGLGGFLLGQGLAATAHPAVRLPDCRGRRDLRCAAATARGARGGRTDPARHDARAFGSIAAGLSRSAANYDSGMDNSVWSLRSSHDRHASDL
jgi:hypothetical protein